MTTHDNKKRSTLFLSLTLLALSISLVTTDPDLKRIVSSSCDWTDWGSYGPCLDGIMTRVRTCLCDGTQAPLQECPGEVPFSDTVACGALESNNETQLHGELYLQQGSGQQETIGETIVDESNSPSMQENNSLTTQQNFIICAWKWTRWTRCTQPCGTNPLGNTTRTQQCWCIGMDQPYVNETMCNNDGTRSTETVECNDFDCGGVRPHNKLYWITLTENAGVWPFSPNTTFLCPRGDDFKFSKISWLQILKDDIYIQNPAWHYLAKEYITSRLNKAGGCPFNKLADLALEEAQYLLTECGNFSALEIQISFLTKEKLARYNNGIGGLSNIDLRMGLAQSGGGTVGNEAGAASNGSGMGVLVVVVIVGVVLVGVVGLYTIHVVRREKKRKTRVIENETFLSSSEEEDGAKDDRSAEELRL